MAFAHSLHELAAKARRTSLSKVTFVLIASDSPQIAAQIQSAFPASQYEVHVVNNGPDVREVCETVAPDLVVLDFQIGSMGGMAVCLDIKLEHSGGRLPDIPVLLLVDRRADVFLARRSSAEGYLVKPIDPIRLRKAAQALLAGETYEDSTAKPNPVLVTEGS
jgi:DNA-binding response OmpR family regulator